MGVQHVDDLGEVWQRPRQSIHLVDQDQIDLASANIGEQTLQAGPLQRAAGDAAIVIGRRQGRPPFVTLATGIGFAGLALRIERVERLLEPFFRRLAGVDRAAAGR